MHLLTADPLACFLLAGWTLALALLGLRLSAPNRRK